MDKTEKDRFTLVPIKKSDVFRQVFDRVKGLVDNLAPAAKLPSERELSEQLGVSRTSVRQALKILEAEGRVESRKGSGTYITDSVTTASGTRLAPARVDRAYMCYLITARAHIEKAIFEEYCFHSTKAGLSVIEDLVNRQVQSLVNEEMSGLDLEFEATVADLLGNPILKSMQEEVHKLWIYAWNAYGFEPEEWELLREEHLHIVAALKERDATRLLMLLDRHINKDI